MNQILIIKFIQTALLLFYLYFVHVSNHILFVYLISFYN